MKRNRFSEEQVSRNGGPAGSHASAGEAEAREGLISRFHVSVHTGAT